MTTKHTTGIIQKSTTRVLVDNVSTATANPSAPNGVSAKARTPEQDMFDMMIRNILIFMPLSLSFVLYFTIMSMVDMPITKSSLLYAKYGSSKTAIQQQ